MLLTVVVVCGYFTISVFVKGCIRTHLYLLYLDSTLSILHSAYCIFRYLVIVTHHFVIICMSEIGNFYVPIPVFNLAYIHIITVRLCARWRNYCFFYSSLCTYTRTYPEFWSYTYWSLEGIGSDEKNMIHLYCIQSGVNILRLQNEHF